MKNERNFAIVVKNHKEKNFHVYFNKYDQAFIYDNFDSALEAEISFSQAYKNAEFSVAEFEIANVKIIE